MDSTTKKVLLGLGIGCVVVVILVVVGAYVVWSKAVRPMLQGATTQPKVGPVGVSVGKGFLTSSVFADKLRTGTVTDIKGGKVDPNPKVAFAVAGDWGADFVSRDGAVVSSVSSTGRYDRVQVVDVEKDGTCEFLNRGSWSSEPALLGHDGTVRWRFRVPHGADDTAAGDVDGDGLLEFVVGCNGSYGIHLLDHLGHERWKQPDGNVWHVEIADVLGKGHPSILNTGHSDGVAIRDANGKITATASGGPDVYVSEFTLVPWPAGGPLHVLAPDENEINIFGVTSAGRATLDAPHASDDSVHATWVRLQPNASPYLAVLVNRELATHALLYVYDARKKLVYQEVLPTSGDALAVLPLPNGKGEALLVGQDNRVLKYVAAGTPKPSASSPRNN